MISWDLTYENIPLSYQQEAAEMSDLPEDPVLPQWTAHSGTFNSIIIFFLLSPCILLTSATSSAKFCWAELNVHLCLLLRCSFYIFSVSVRSRKEELKAETQQFSFNLQHHKKERISKEISLFPFLGSH